MKKFWITLIVILTASGAQAQLRTATESIRETRKYLEAETERTVLEQLERQRLEDERARMQRFESLNFSVVGQGQTQEDPYSDSYYF